MNKKQKNSPAVCEHVINAVRNGEIKPLFSANFKSPKAYKKKFTPKQKCLTIEDVNKQLKDAEAELQLLTSARAALVIDREEFISILMKLCVTRNPGLNKEFDNSHEFASDEEAQKITTAVEEVKAIISRFTEDDFGFEDFRALMSQTTCPDESDRVLNSCKSKALNAYSRFGVSNLEVPPKTLQYLPSKYLHQITVSVTRGFVEATKEVTICIVSADKCKLTFVKKQQQFTLSNLDKSARQEFMSAQANHCNLEIVVRIPAISIFTTTKRLPSMELETILQVIAGSAPPPSPQIDMPFKPDK